MDAATHCPHAGPSGGGACGSYCEALCSLVNKSCTGANLAYTDYPNCIAMCANMNQTGQVMPALVQSGNTVQCRIYHATVASSSASAATTHCQHTSPSGQGACGTVCENYCYTAMKSCTTMFTSAADCTALCSQFPAGKFSDQGNNTAECRVYHASVAGTTGSGNIATHCPHASPSGGGVCGTLCDVYCQLASLCTGGNAIYPGGTSECMNACTTIATNGMPGDTSGDSIHCRIYHLGVAAQSSNNMATHCPHGKVSSDTCGGAKTGTTTTTGFGQLLLAPIFFLLSVFLF
jgi:hypothetical protein